MATTLQLAQDRFDSLPYVRFVAEASEALEGLRRSQIQLAFAIESFPRALAHLAARIEDPVSRLALVRRLWDEHGEGDPSWFRGYTFDAFLRRLGVPAAEIDRAEASPAVRAFAAALLGLAAAEPVPFAAGAFGMVEFAQRAISARLARIAIARGWIQSDRIIHHDPEEDLEADRAAELLEVGAADPALLARGMELGGYLIECLYEELEDEARAVAERSDPLEALRAACA